MQKPLLLTPSPPLIRVSSQDAVFVSDDNCTAVLVAKYCELAVRSQALLAHPLQQLHMEALCDELGALVALHSSPSHAGKDTDHRQKSATIPSPQSTLKPQHRKPVSQLQLGVRSSAWCPS